MLTTLVFPLADLRPFAKDGLGRQKRPDWRNPDPSQDFLRYIGPVRERFLGGGNDYLREGYFCKADRLLRSVSRERKGAEWRVGALRRFVRFYSDGCVLGKLEVGVILGQKAYGKTVPSAESLARSLLTEPCALPNGKNASPRPLIELGRSFAELYQLCSTRTSYPLELENHPERMWVQAAAPIVVTHLNASERFAVPSEDRRLKLDGGSKHELYHSRVKLRGQFIRHWTIVGQSANPEDPTRLLRMYLVRLYSENTVLRTVLRELDNLEIAEDDDDSRDRLQTYLNEATHRISQMAQKSSRIAGHEMGTLARVAEDTIRPGDIEMLHENVDALKFRREIVFKTKQYVSRDANTHITVEEGGFLYMTANKNVNYGTQGSVQQAGAQAVQSAQTKLSGEPTDVASALAALKELAAQLGGELPAEDAANVKKAVSHLDAELSSNDAKPDKGIVLGALEKIGNAAEKVGKYAEPVGKIAKLIRTFLGF